MKNQDRKKQMSSEEEVVDAGHSGNSAFGVVGLTERIRDIVGAPGVMIETGLVRYRGKFVCDGLVSRLVYLGPGYHKSYGAIYRDLRTQGRLQVDCEA